MSEPTTLVNWVAHWAAFAPNRVALRSRGRDGSWRALSYRGYHEQLCDFARGLMALGHQPGDPVTIVGKNRPEWVIAELGITAAGGIPAPIYPNSTPEQTAYIIRHTDAKIAVCEDREQLDKHRACLDDGPLSTIITLDAIEHDDDRIRSFEAVSRLGRERKVELEPELDERVAAARPDDVALLIFTSGTTGLPKGAELTHDNIAGAHEAVDQFYPEVRQLDYACVSYLPLSHVAEQLFTNFMCLSRGGTAWFCSDLTKVKDYLVEARPTVFLAVPRVWEKFEAALRAQLGAATGIKARLAAWAMQTELDAFRRELAEDREIGGLPRLFAQKLVLDKVKQALGFDRLVVPVSGAAPISLSTLEFFASLGIEIVEGFGMTETSGVCTSQPLRRPHLGKVGRPLSGVELKIAGDGEILVRGKNVVRGYYKLPKETAELYEGDWMKTGDLGELDADGFLTITGRKKDLIITAGGKNVAPAEIEHLLSPLPGVGQAVVVGDRKPYLGALLALDPESCDQLADAAGSNAASLAEIAECEQVRRFVQRHIDEHCNPKLARYQTIKKFRILPEPFSVEGGELTPTMKVKRNVVGDKYAAHIEALYAGGTLNTPGA